MTYFELAQKIAKMDNQELMQDVTAYFKKSQKHIPVESIKAVGDLYGFPAEEGHQILIIDA